MKVEFDLDDEIKRRFDMAIKLNDENEQVVLKRLVSEYISKVFFDIARETATGSSENEIKIKDTVQEVRYAKAIRKMPMWATKPNQNNHKIIKAYLQIMNNNGEVLIKALEDRCSNAEDFPDTFVKDFRGNFAQMRTDAGNSHGKVFELVGDYVLVWSEIQKTLDKYKNKFINSVESEVENMGITIDMSIEAYPIAKRVYEGNMTRTEGQLVIANKTGMNAGSAFAYITIFLAMMDGVVYKRAFNNQTNKFLLESIREDYGEEAFKKALAAAQKHAEYYATLGKGHLVGLEKIIDEMRKTL